MDIRSGQAHCRNRKMGSPGPSPLPSSHLDWNPRQPAEKKKETLGQSGGSVDLGQLGSTTRTIEATRATQGQSRNARISSLLLWFPVLLFLLHAMLLHCQRINSQPPASLPACQLASSSPACPSARLPARLPRCTHM